MEVLKQLIKLRVLKLHKPDLIDPRTAKGILPGKTFVKVKFDPNGTFDRIKARLVSDWMTQIETLLPVQRDRNIIAHDILSWTIHNCINCSTRRPQT
jgi:hypothetical protein